MGLIALVCLGAFLCAVLIVIIAYGYVIHLILKKNGAFKIIQIFSILSITAIAVIPLLFLYQYYQQNTDMIYIRGFFGLAPQFTTDFKINCGNGILRYKEEVNYNTGARGGAIIHTDFLYIVEKKERRINIKYWDEKTSNNYFDAAITIREYTNEKKRSFSFSEKRNKYDFIIDSDHFSKDEFQIIGNAIKTNILELENAINKSRKSKSHVFPNYFYKIRYQKIHKE